jgi:hypothetical protein
MQPPRPPSPRSRVLSGVLDFLRAMRTAPCTAADEAMEWATLEKEFGTRITHEQEA